MWQKDIQISTSISFLMSLCDTPFCTRPDLTPMASLSNLVPPFPILARSKVHYPQPSADSHWCTLMSTKWIVSSHALNEIDLSRQRHGHESRQMLNVGSWSWLSVWTCSTCSSLQHLNFGSWKFVWLKACEQDYAANIFRAFQALNSKFYWVEAITFHWEELHWD